MFKKIAILLVALLLLLYLFGIWYRSNYSMTKVDTIELNNEGLAGRVLIASQGSDYKEAVVGRLSKEFVHLNASVRIMDVTDLDDVDPLDWDAIIVLHTWEYWEPQAEAAAFLARYSDKGNIIALSTSGSGDEKLDTVDGISSASVMDEAASDADRILDRAKAFLIRDRSFSDQLLEGGTD